MSMSYDAEQYHSLCTTLWQLIGTPTDDERGEHVAVIIQQRMALLKLKRDTFERQYHDADSVVAELRARTQRFREALGFIAEEQDRGRGDGQPEPGPAHDDVTMWAVALNALREG